MSKALSKVGKQTPIYLAGVIANRAAGFVMLPVYTSYLTTSDYGVLELLMLTVDIIGTIGAVGLSSGVFKFHAEFDDPEEQNAVLSTAAFGVAALTFLLCAIGYAFSAPISDLVLGEVGRPHYFKIVFAIYLLRQLDVVPLLLLRIRDRPVSFVAIEVARLMIMLSMNIWLVVFRDMHVMGVLISNLTASGLFGLGLSVYLLRSVGVQFARPLFWRMLKFGFPMVFWFLGNFVLIFSDRYFLNYFSGSDVVGIYSLGYRFVMLVPAFAFQPFKKVWQPQSFALAKRPDSGETFTHAFTYLNLGLGAVTLLVALFTQDVLRIMSDPSFHSAYRVVPVLLLAQVMYHWVGFANLGLLLKERTDVLAWIGAVSAILVLGLHLLLVPRFGMMGAAFATLIVYFFRFMLVLLTAQRHFHIDYAWGRVLALYGIIGSTAALKLVVPMLPMGQSVTLELALFIFASGVIYGALLKNEEREAVRRLIRRIFDRMRPRITP